MMTAYTANPEAGEMLIELGGKMYPMRPSMRCGIDIERATGKNILPLIMRCRNNYDISFDEICAVVFYGIRHAGQNLNDEMLKNVDLDRIEELIFERGTGLVAAEILPFLINLMAGGAKESKKKIEDGSNPIT